MSTVLLSSRMQGERSQVNMRPMKTGDFILLSCGKKSRPIKKSHHREKLLPIFEGAEFEINIRFWRLSKERFPVKRREG